MKSVCASRRYRARSLFAGAVFALATGAVNAADKLFAAPASSGAAATSSAGSLGQVTLALSVVLALVFVAAWALKKMRAVQQGSTSAGIEIISQVALGTKERAILLKVMGQHVLVGVAPGKVTALHVLPVGSEAATSPLVQPTLGAQETSTKPLPSFQAILKRSLGLS
ncbi:MAG: flagellar biosynthetic protein FliO [Candidatus Obscuribacterales bacterium]|nr:flagellar biosynthetic protein FliO [Steroidobacteraceae bacterium]